MEFALMIFVVINCKNMEKWLLHRLVKIGDIMTFPHNTYYRLHSMARVTSLEQLSLAEFSSGQFFSLRNIKIGEQLLLLTYFDNCDF